jgi:hypothetical protein
VYDRVQHKGVWRGVMTRTTATGAAMAMVMIADADLSDDDKIAVEREIKDAFVARIAAGLALQCLLLQTNNTKVCLVCFFLHELFLGLSRRYAVGIV